MVIIYHQHLQREKRYFALQERNRPSSQAANTNLTMTFSSIAHKQKKCKQLSCAEAVMTEGCLLLHLLTFSNGFFFWMYPSYTMLQNAEIP